MGQGSGEEKVRTNVTTVGSSIVGDATMGSGQGPREDRGRTNVATVGNSIVGGSAMGTTQGAGEKRKPEAHEVEGEEMNELCAFDFAGECQETVDTYLAPLDLAGHGDEKADRHVVERLAEESRPHVAGGFLPA